ncbi:MAG TPA: 16S rRNA (guanine(966)-N(2))-methyltransferase RsmD, partial [Acidobacteriota bacterium]|nr:16S rRNA (guanine(966)-N(2))-methyltransferase RsmD [Acidobacteriota bacterium]
GGSYKGRRLKLVPSASVRPMQDKVKGALFNILGDRVKGAVCLDGFAGTGSIGLEALSRGAARCVFVDEFYPSVKVIRQNVETCGAGDASVVLHREFNRAVIDLAKQGVRFDIVFLDPPYRLLEERNPLRVLRKRNVVKPGGLVVLRYYYRVKPRLGDFPLARRTKLGDDVIALFENGPGGVDEAASGAAAAVPNAALKAPKAPRARLPRAPRSPKISA